MKKLIILLDSLLEKFKDQNFLKLIHIVENIVSKILSLALIVVILFCLFELIVILITEIFFTPPFGFFNRIFEIFGLFLNILIALELLENITVYLKKHVVQVELVLITALIAIARKIIIFDPSYSQKIDLIPLGIASLCLAGSYFLVRYSNFQKK